MAVHVTVIVPTGNGSVMGLLSLRLGTGVTLPSQLSVTVGTPRFTVAEQDPVGLVTVTVLGQVIFGASVSFTVTVCVHDEWLPELSVAVHVIVVVPFG